MDRLECRIARRNTGPAIGDNRVNLGLGQEGPHDRRNLLRFVFKNLIRDDRLTLFGQEFSDAFAARIRLFGPGVAQGDYCAPNRPVGFASMLCHSHSSCVYTS